MKNNKDRIGKNYHNLVVYFLNACSDNFFLGVYKLVYFQNKLINQTNFFD